jgi:hypothetical protein
MKVKEFIEMLSKLDQEKEIKVYGAAYDGIGGDDEWVTPAITIETFEDIERNNTVPPFMVENKTINGKRDSNTDFYVIRSEDA